MHFTSYICYEVSIDDNVHGDSLRTEKKTFKQKKIFYVKIL